MEEIDGVAEYRDRLLALPCLKETSYPRCLLLDKYNDDRDTSLIISYLQGDSSMGLGSSAGKVKKSESFDAAKTFKNTRNVEFVY